MSVRRFRLGAGLAVALVLLAAALTGSAHAQVDKVLTVNPQADIVWIDASVAQAQADGLEINILGGKRRSLIQRCTFAYSGPGIYRCGIEADGSKTTREMVANLVVDGDKIATVRFSL